MTAGQLAIVIAEDYGNEASIEDLIDAVGILVKRDRDAYVASLLERSERVDEKDLVLACLDGCQEHLSNASMAWYASTK